MRKSISFDIRKSTKNNKEKWVSLHNEARFRPRYPIEEVVQFVFRNYRNARSDVRILDAGCGAGRHVKFLADEGFIPYGIDFSESGVEYTKKMLSLSDHDKFTPNILCGSIAELPFKKSYFNAIVCWAVLYYLSEKDIKNAILEFHRVLKRKGKLLLFVRNTDDYRYVNSANKNGFYATINESSKSRNAFSENGMTLFFFEQHYIENLFKTTWGGECKIEIERDVKTIENGQYADSNFLIIVTKN